MQLDPQTCYRALQTRDARFDGRFFTAVRSTGVFCRPICPARTPRLELVGIISIGDVVKTRIAELECESDAMRNYISGRQWREQSQRLGPADFRT